MCRAYLATDCSSDNRIKIEFSIDAINELSEEYDEEDPGLEDEDLDLPGSSSGSAGRRNNINQSNQGGKVSVAPEDSIAASDLAARGEEVTEEHETDQSEDAGPSIPVDLQITISKSAQSQAGAMQIHAYTDDGLIKIRHISHYPSAQVATASTTEAAKEAAILYTGPPFENLDSELCAILEQYIEERGVNVELAQFVPEYVDYKEQREYVQWLQSKSLRAPHPPMCPCTVAQSVWDLLTTKIQISRSSSMPRLGSTYVIACRAGHKNDRPGAEQAPLLPNRYFTSLLMHNNWADLMAFNSTPLLLRTSERCVEISVRVGDSF